MRLSKPKAVIFDIDGVLADLSHRLHYIRCETPDWDTFYRAMNDDPLVQGWPELLSILLKDHQIVLLTGRPNRYMGETISWLYRNKIRFNEIVMRDDLSQAHEYKSRAINMLMDKYDIVLAVDDDPHVFQAFIEMGVPAILAHNGIYDGGRSWEPMDVTG